ncbi:MAG: SDR family oxidoreductase [Saprospiraceae bacterium]|nr:SDR family oxidoreductase [Saprospiraceae bacterium]
MVFKDKVIWITGASSGIGEHLAYAFSEQGAKLILSSRNQQELNRVKQNCSQPDAIRILPLDVAQFEQVPATYKQAVQDWGPPNIVINNAGVSQRELVKDTDFSVDEKIMDVNFLGAVAVTKAVLPDMLARKSGQIVVISSVMGKIGTPFRSAYAASKHALQGWFDCLREEVLKDNLKVTIICPGYVHTNATINALKGDGSKNNKMAESTAGGMEPSVFAQRALRAIANEKDEVLIGGKEIATVYLKRISSRLLKYVLRRATVT